MTPEPQSVDLGFKPIKSNLPALEPLSGLFSWRSPRECKCLDSESPGRRVPAPSAGLT